MEEQLQNRRFSTYILSPDVSFEDKEVSKPLEVEEPMELEEPRIPEEVEIEDSIIDLVPEEVPMEEIPIEETHMEEKHVEVESIEEPVEETLIEVERQDSVEEKPEEPKQEMEIKPTLQTAQTKQSSASAREVADTIQQALFKTVLESSNKGMQKQTKIKEYKLTAQQISTAELIILDGVVCKDRECLYKVKGNNDKINMAEHNIIIGINGHILYTSFGQVVKVQKPKLRLPKDKHYRT